MIFWPPASSTHGDSDKKANHRSIKKRDSQVLIVKMAAIIGHVNFWNMTSEEAMLRVWLRVSNVKTISSTVAVLAMVMSPIIVFGNSLVVLSVWKDPLKKLRSSPSNFIILSMAIADLLVGSVACPLTVYWGWSIFLNKDPTFGPLAFFSVLINVSVGHVFLLTIDRFFALVTPLYYRVRVTNKRVCIATATCWIYFLLFGSMFGLLQKHYVILGTIYNLQIFFILICIVVINCVILYRFHKYSSTTEAQGQSTANRRMMLQRERNLFKAIAIVICAFLISFMPWFIVQILIYFCIPCNRNLSVLMLVYAFTAAVMYANSGVNPFLYAWRLPKYRDTFKRFLKNRRRCCIKSNRQDDNFVCDTRL